MNDTQARGRRGAMVGESDGFVGGASTSSMDDEADKITVANSKRSMQWMVGTVYVYGERDT